jgi:hypothetical protein
MDVQLTNHLTLARLREVGMANKFCKFVLLSLLLMAVLSPVLQLDSCDRFPVSTGDIEAEITYCLCSIGMVLAFAGVLRYLLEHSFYFLPLFVSSECFVFPTVVANLDYGGASSAIPLRI